MNRRDFLRSAGVVSASLAFPKPERLFAQGVPALAHVRSDNARRSPETFRRPRGCGCRRRLSSKTPFQKTLANTFQCEGGTAKIVESKTDALGIVAAEFPPGVKPVLTLTSRVATRD